MSVLTAASVREAEEMTVKGGISFLSLMKTAGQAAANIIMQKYDLKGKRVAVVCGVGNNAGDGFVITDAIKNIANVSVVIPFGEPKTDNARHYFDALCGVRITHVLEGEYDFIIDAIFGIGLNRALGQEVVTLIDKINSYDAVRIAIDIPSGANADTGEVMGAVVRADFTVTFIALKPCFLLPPTSDFCGAVQVADIGVKLQKEDYHIISEPSPIKRRHNSHKGDYKSALSICGSYGMCGAAILAARAALRTGIGILRAVVCDKIYSPFTAAVPEAVCVVVKTSRFSGPKASDKRIYEALSKAQAVLVGCGLGNNSATQKIAEKIIEKAECPIILDADGINAINNRINIIRRAKAAVVITPHPAEMGRIWGVSAAEIEKNRIYYAKKTAQNFGCITVLKGANTIVADQNGEIWFNITGNPGMATGGSGDVLSGIILSLLARGFSPLEAAKRGVFLHGQSADSAKHIYGEEALLPSDIIKSLSI